MTEWGVVTVIVTLLGAAAAFAAPIIKLIRAITTLTVVMQGLKETVDKNYEDNKASHQRIWEHNNEQDDTLNNHETRLTVLEKK